MAETNEFLDSIRKKHIEERNQMEACSAYDASALILDTLREFLLPENKDSNERFKEIMNDFLGRDNENNVNESQKSDANEPKKGKKVRKNILMFYPVGRETAIHPIFRELLKAGYNLYFPKTYKDRIEFFKLSSFNNLIPGKMDIPEPMGNTDKWKNNFEGICIIPGVVFDRTGQRAGYGKGYYDKFLSKQNNLLKIGICYENQMEDRLPSNEWDVPMDMLITEKGLSDFRNKEKVVI